jgi:putative membrane protein
VLLPAHQVFPAGELGIFYDDLYHLVKPLHEVNHLAHPPTLFLTRDQHHAHCIASQSPTAIGERWHHRGKSTHSPLIPPMAPYSAMSIARSVSGASSSHSVPPPLLPASSQHSPSLLDRVSADLIPFAAHLRGIFMFYRSDGKSNRQPVCTLHATDCRTPALIRIDGRGLV